MNCPLGLYSRRTSVGVITVKRACPETILAEDLAPRPDRPPTAARAAPAVATIIRIEVAPLSAPTSSERLTCSKSLCPPSDIVNAASASCHGSLGNFPMASHHPPRNISKGSIETLVRLSKFTCAILLPPDLGGSPTFTFHGLRILFFQFFQQYGVKPSLMHRSVPLAGTGISSQPT
jgi:hypothetical protein